MNEQTQINPIAEDSEYSIICPYCFNTANGGNGLPFAHTQVHFRANTVFTSQREIEQKLGFKEIDIDMADSQVERDEKKKKFDKHRKFMAGISDQYDTFWKTYGGTSEQASSAGSGANPWERPIIKKGGGVKDLVADKDGFITHATDEFGATTYDRVCPYCHNPLPLGFGKYEVKNISIVGISGSGKTVYISQLLKGMSDYAARSGLAAFFTSDHETNFIRTNRVDMNVPLPQATAKESLSQPMFYDIVKSEGHNQKTTTIVLYDIAGENCADANSMIKFSQFVKNSHGIILLVDPKQLGFIPGYIPNSEERDVIPPSTALNTLHNVLESAEGQLSDLPIAVTISKSDLCSNIIHSVAQEQVTTSERDEYGKRRQEFDGRTYNILAANIRDLIDRNTTDVCQMLQNSFLNYNFFAVSAIGCECIKNESGDNAPINIPNPKRIEEPILWLFKHFGFIKSNEKVTRPFKIQLQPMYEFKKPLIGKAHLKRADTQIAVYEEDAVYKYEMVSENGILSPKDPKYSDLIIK